MKRKALIRHITSQGCEFVRHGSKHDLYLNPATGKRQPVPWHDEIDENLAKHIIKELSNKIE
jgi:predicted RNA binding protein YcfA (HicA-like mRNA interferase family)